ncbi:MAG TPA: HAD family hydrolase [Deltaproteobacteria bacterium]|nr:HAD family hydrolase [Deltaproteobacteria bacterium]HIJ40509.1 HAD family hydrolase [Deltaproteobacteria bacterium]
MKRTDCQEGLAFKSTLYYECEMQKIKAIGFDLFNTLLTAKPNALATAVARLIGSLQESGISFEPEMFIEAHKKAAFRFIKETRTKGKETHNRFWISAALEDLGLALSPEDLRIENAVDAYFSAFFDYCELIPGTLQMLENLKAHYRIGLLSNFTHAPAARKIIETLGLTPYFEFIIISGEVGYCKPHRVVFDELVEKMQVEREEILFVGDDPDADIGGALDAGIKPVWMTYANNKEIPFASSDADMNRYGFLKDVQKITDWDDFLALFDRE